jgi:hypothetical protein
MTMTTSDQLQEVPGVESNTAMATPLSRYVSVDNAPELVPALDALRRLDTRDMRSRGCRPFVAGGAARDLILGRRPRDWDVFMATSTARFLPAVFAANDALKAGGWTITEVNGSLYLMGGGIGPACLGNVKLTHSESRTKLDLVYVDAEKLRPPTCEPKDIVQRFDTSINQAWLEPDETYGVALRWLPAFERSVTDRTIEVFDYGEGSHIGRMQEAFPDFVIKDSRPADINDTRIF